MDLRKYFAPLLVWWWLILLAIALAAAPAYYLTRQQPPVYLSRTTLIIGRTIYDPNPNANEIGLTQQLAGLYAAIAQREMVRNATEDALGLTALPKYTALAKGQMLEISVTDTDQARAQAVADELANQLILTSPTGSREGDQSRQTFVSQQLDDLENKIVDTKAEIAAQQAAMESLSSAADLAETRNAILGLELRLTTLQTNYANLLAGTGQSATNTLTVIEPASYPTLPIGPNVWLATALAAFSGGLLAVGAAYLLEFLDDTIRSPDDITRELPYPILGYISEMGRSKSGRPYVAERPFSITAEAFRSLRTNLEFSSIDQPLKILLVSSSIAGDGKTSVAANLAFVIAQGGKRVILLDADMRQSSLQKHVSAPDHLGLSDVFRGQVTLPEVVQEISEGVAVVLSGNPPPNPAELLASKKMDQILAAVREMADVVVVDGPPFILSDALILASKVDGMLVVTRPGHTPRGALRAMAEQIKRSGVRVVGIALNGLPNQHVEHYGGYRYIVNYRETLPPAPAKLNLLSPSRQREMLLGRLSELQRLFGRAAKTPTSASVEPMSENGHEVVTSAEAETPPPEIAAEDQAQLAQLHDLSRALADSLDMEALLLQVMPLALETVGALSGSIVLFDAEGSVANGVFAYGGDVQPITEHQLADVVEHGLAGWVFRHRRATIIANTRDDPRWLSRQWDEQSESAARSAASIPLLANNRVVGVLTVVSSEVGKFNRTHLAVLTAIAVGITLKWYLTRPVSA